MTNIATKNYVKSKQNDSSIAFKNTQIMSDKYSLKESTNNQRI